MPLTYEAVSELLDPVMPGLLSIAQVITRDRKIREGYFHFILLSLFAADTRWR